MSRLTNLRVNGIKTGYWSPSKKEELVQRLAAYEDTGLEPEEIMDGKMLSGWIPVKERLPQQTGNYLVTVLSSDGTADIYFDAIDHFNSGRYSGWTTYHLDGPKNKQKVEAWMPLPEKYKR